jgi:LacI family transcriptional regulator
VTSLTNPFYADLVSGAASVLEAAGFFPMIVNLEDNRERQPRFARWLNENMAAGCMLSLAPGTSRAAVAEWHRTAPRSVMLLRYPPGGFFDFIGVDNYEGTVAAVQHLIALGHRAIGFLGGVDGSASRAERLRGWRTAMEQVGGAAGETLTEFCGASISEGSAGVQRLMQRHPEITAIACYQDVVAFGATIGLRKLGIEPGRELSITGFDDISMAADWDPALTTISVSPRELGAEAARLLIRRIAEPAAPIKSLYIRPQLVVRDSTAPRPAA